MKSIEQRIAKRFVAAKNTTKFLNFTTWITVLGIALGATSLMTVLAVMDGFESSLEEVITKVRSHFTVSSVDGVLAEPDLVEGRVRQVLGDDIKNLTPYIGSSVMFARLGRVKAGFLEGSTLDSGPESMRSFLIKGRFPKADLRNSSLQEEGSGNETRSINERDRETSTIPEIVLGYYLVRELDLRLGDLVSVIRPSGGGSVDGLTPYSENFRLVGVLRLGMYQYDSKIAVTTVTAAKNFFQMGNAVSGLRALTADAFSSRDQVSRLRGALTFPLSVKDWSDFHPNLFSAIQLERKVMFTILIFIILVASFNVVSTLVMLTQEKSREIAILKAMGASNWRIMSIFLRIAVSIGLWGFLGGLLVSAGLVALIERFPLISLHEEIYSLSTLPAELRFTNVILVGVCSVLICGVAAFIPAWIASKKMPAEELQHD
jgi:lipoprotein-releasing system permease protein